MQHSLTTIAEEELIATARYYSQKASPRIAKAFIAEFKRAIMLLEQNQQIRTPTEAGLRIYPFRRFPYSIVYEESKTGPLVYAIASQYRRPNYWLDRIE